MQIYRRCLPAKVISFDLDDTLYDNVPIITKAETKLLEFVNNKLIAANVPELTAQQWQQLKQNFANQNTMLAHNVSALRQAFLTDLFTRNKLTQANKTAQQAYQLFYQYRNNFNVAKSQVELLNRLKNNYSLIAVTNGNAEPDLIGLNGVFDLVLRPQQNLRMKPAVDLFKQASELLEVKPQQILHVGDSEFTDVAGAINSGCQAAWFNDSGRLYQGRVLPHLQVSSIKTLVDWLVV